MPSFSCALCPVILMSRRGLSIHMQKVHRDAPKVLRCTKCDFVTEDRNDHVRHRRSHEQKKLPKAAAKFTKCDACEYVATSVRELYKHRREVHPDVDRVHVCRDCGFRAYTRSRLLKHRVEHDGRSTRCDVCGFVLKSVRLLQVHKKIVHCPPSFTCDICGEKFRRPHQLRNHQKRMHARKKEEKCTRCGLELYTKNELKIHMKQKHYGKFFKCHVCHKAFPRSTERLRHIKAVHMKYRPFSCDLCDYRTNERRNLNRHLLSMHNRVVPAASYVKCEHCRGQFVSRRYLRMHITMKHADVAAIRCELCDFETKERFELERHHSANHVINTRDQIYAVPPVESTLPDDFMA